MIVLGALQEEHDPFVFVRLADGSIVPIEFDEFDPATMVAADREDLLA